MKGRGWRSTGYDNIINEPAHLKTRGVIIKSLEKINPIFCLISLLKSRSSLSVLRVSAVSSEFEAATARRVAGCRFWMVDLSDLGIMNLNLSEKRSVEFNNSGEWVRDIPGCDHELEGRLWRKRNDKYLSDKAVLTMKNRK